MEGVLGEATLRQAVFLLVRLVEAAGAFIIFIGAAIAFVRFVWTGTTRREQRIGRRLAQTRPRCLTHPSP